MDEHRVAERLKSLRRRFAADVKVKQFNKDQDHLTDDTGSAQIHHRTFFLGEIFWVARPAWNGCGGFGNNPTRDHHPGLVVSKQPHPLVPVTMAPGTTRPRLSLDNGVEALNFVPEQEPSWAKRKEARPETTAFVLNFCRPVPRRQITFHLATLQYHDRDRLQRAAFRLQNGSVAGESIDREAE